VLTSIICSVDSFIAAIAMARAGAPVRQQRLAIGGFVICDMVASAIGVWLGIRLPPVAMIVAAVLAAGVLLAARRWPALWVAVPAALCLDNLMLHDVSASRLASVMLDGAWSGVLAYLGFALAQRRIVPLKSGHSAQLQIR